MTDRFAVGLRPGLDPRLIFLLAFAAGGAAVASLFLVGHTATWFVSYSAAVAVAYGGPALVGRRLSVTLLVTSVPVAFVVILAGPFAHPSRYFGLALLLGPLFALVFGLPARIARRARAQASHDAFDHVLLNASLWLGVIAGGAAVISMVRLDGPIMQFLLGVSTLAMRLASFFGDFPLEVGLGHGQLSWIAPGLALALGASLAGVTLARDAGRLRFLRAVREGREPLWEIVPRSEIERRGVGASPGRYLSGLGDDGALLVRTAEGTSAFREGASSSVMAWIPLDLTQVTHAVMRRMAVCTVLLFTQGAGVAALAGALLAHREPLTGIVSVAPGEDHVCALRRDGAVLCWGANAEGQLGDGTNRQSFSPVAVADLHDAIELSDSCALRRSGEVVCWGGTSRGQWTPQPVPGLPASRALASSPDGGCALTRDDEVYCWYENRASLARMASHIGALPTLARTEFGACLSTVEGLQCWRLYRTTHFNPDKDALLGCPSPRDAPAPVVGSLFAVGGMGPEREMVCEVRVPGRLRCWQRRPECATYSDDHRIEGARRVAWSSWDFPYSLDADGLVRRWTWLGQGEQVLKGVVDLASNGTTLICAVRADGTVWCWGSRNDWGELGDGTHRSSALPVQVRR